MSFALDSYVFFPQQLRLLSAISGDVQTADALPDLTIVLNHRGGPLGYGPYAENKAEHYG